jgi:outer membrane protein assembly factor BamB
MKSLSLGVTAVSLMLLGSGVLGAELNWPMFRGPGANGVVDNAGLPERWTDSQNVSWRVDVEGRGWSSPIVWGNQVFLTTVINESVSESPKKGLYFGGNRLEPAQSKHHWVVLSLDIETGKTLWRKEVHVGIPGTPIHLKNSYASETPVTDGEHLYVVFGNLGVYCLDLKGKLIWKKELPRRKVRYGWGTASSPVIHGDRLYLVDDNDEQSTLTALEKRTGKQVWQVKRKERSNWATPYVWENKLRTEIITPGTQKTRSYDLEGNLLYEFGGGSSITIATPYARHGLLYVSSGYVMDRKRPLMALRPGAHGDISLKADQQNNEFVAWCQKQGGPYNPTTLVYRDLLYVLLDRGFLSCYDARTGEEVYSKKRLPNGKAFTSSPWASDGKIYCLNEDGLTFVIRAGREYKLLYKNALAEDDMCMATPAIVGNRLLVRTSARLYCVRKSPGNR